MAARKTQATRSSKLRVITHASEILTGAGLRAKQGRRPSEEDLGRIEDGALVYSVRSITGKKACEVPDKIEWVGSTSELPKRYRTLKSRDLKGRQAVIPGLVDCHTHLIFAGDRSDEFAARCGGATYEQIAAKGGGIAKTVRSTREASLKELLRLATARVREAASFGVRTLEIKSGYALSHEGEIKQLRVIQELRKLFPEMAFSSTYLGAHDFPKDRPRGDYLQELLNKTLPEVSRLKLADSCDVFVDRGYYTLEEGRRVLEKAKSLGLRVKIHADEFADTGSAALAAELGALSADHLLQVSEAGIARLSRSDTVAVLLPGTAFYLKSNYAPARRLIQAGAVVALATDFNPGSCMTLSLPAIMTLAALYLGMSRAEIFAAVTLNAAQALAMHDRRGTLEPGLEAAFAVLPFKRFDEMYYRFAWSGGAELR